jgi:hypothetical protein
MANERPVVSCRLALTHFSPFCYNICYAIPPTLEFLFPSNELKVIDWLAKYCSREKCEAVLILLYAVSFRAKESYGSNLIWFGFPEPNAPGENDFSQIGLICPARIF